MKPLYVYVYTRPMWMIYAVMAVLFVGWTAAAAILRRQSFGARHRWKLFNAVVLLAALAVIVCGTLLTREGRERTIIWQLGSMFRTYGVSNEAWRLLIMNCLLFFPLGLALPNVLPHGMPPAWRVVLTLVISFLLSSALEQMQYHFSLGVTELDDIVCNTVGGFVASLHTLAYGKREKR
ncbi:MAG: VanZ family protein [Oscillospiraceae bacterium]|nr:VanZ family protein [Oscillospiraceae bacterium]